MLLQVDMHSMQQNCVQVFPLKQMSFLADVTNWLCDHARNGSLCDEGKSLTTSIPMQSALAPFTMAFFLFQLVLDNGTKLFRQGFVFC